MPKNEGSQFLVTTKNNRSSTDQESNNHTESTQLDQGWAWVVCAAAFLCLFMLGGLQYSFGVIVMALLDEFDKGQSETAWVGSICAFFWFFFGHLSGLLCERFGCRAVTISAGVTISLGLLLSSFATSLWHLYFSFSLLVGLGSSLMYVSSVLSVGFYFQKRRSFATGISATGTNVGTFAISQAQRILIELYTWRINMRVISLTSLVVIVVCGALFKPQRTKKDFSLKQNMEQNSSCCELFTNVKYVLWTSAICIGLLGYLIPYYILVSHSRSLGIQSDDSSYLITCISIGSAAGKIVYGKLADLTGKTITIYQICMLFCGISSMLVMLASNFPSLVIYAFVYGIMDGGIIGLMLIGTIECVHPRNISQAFGCVLMMQSFTILIGPPLAGLIIDHYKDSVYTFYLSGVPMIIGAAVLALIHFVQKKTDFTNRQDIAKVEEHEYEIIYERETVL